MHREQANAGTGFDRSDHVRAHDAPTTHIRHSKQRNVAAA
jgi:hypothetical protein